MYEYNQFKYLRQILREQKTREELLDQLERNYFLELNVYKSEYRFSSKEKNSYDYQYYTPQQQVQKYKFLYIPTELSFEISQEWGTQSPQTELFENLQRIQSLTNFLSPLREIYRQIFFPKMNFGLNPRSDVSVQLELFYQDTEEIGELWYNVIQEPVLRLQYYVSPEILPSQQGQEQTGQQQTTQLQITRQLGNLLEKQQNIFKIAQVKPSNHIFSVNIQNVIFLPQQLIKSLTWSFNDIFVKSRKTRNMIRPSKCSLEIQFEDIYPIIYRSIGNKQVDQFNQPIVQEDTYQVMIQNGTPRVVKQGTTMRGKYKID